MLFWMMREGGRRTDKKKKNSFYCVAIENRVMCTSFASNSYGLGSWLCVTYGGGYRRCIYVDEAGKACKSAAQGVTGSKKKSTLCATHGGGDRCVHVDNQERDCAPYL